MTQRDWMPDNTNPLTPYLMVKDAERTLAFYKSAFGFEGSVMLRDEHGAPMYCEARYLDTTLVMFAPEGTFGSPQKAPLTSGEPSPIGLYVYCEDVDALVARAVGVGAEAVGGVGTQFWGDRTGCLRDPDGYVWTFATKVAEFDPAKVPPGSAM